MSHELQHVNYLQLTQDVEDGNESALRALAILKLIKKDVEQCIELIEAEAMTEAEGYGSKQFDAHGFRFERREGRRIPDFSNIEEWNKRKAELKEIEDNAKKAAQAVERGQQFVNKSTGEVVEPCAIKYSKPSITAKPVSS